MIQFSGRRGSLHKKIIGSHHFYEVTMLNLFFVDDDLTLAAQYHPDPILKKSIFDICCVLSAVIFESYRSGEDLVNLPLYYQGGSFPQSHSIIWARESPQNYTKTVDLLTALMTEYEHRFTTPHVSKPVYETIKNIPIQKLRLAKAAPTRPFFPDIPAHYHLDVKGKLVVSGLKDKLSVPVSLKKYFKETFAKVYTKRPIPDFMHPEAPEVRFTANSYTTASDSILSRALNDYDIYPEPEEAEVG